VAREARSVRTIALRMIGVLALLGCPRVGRAQGEWSILAAQGGAPGQVVNPTALRVDSAGNLYVGDQWQVVVDRNLESVDRLQKRDVQGNWSMIATSGPALDQAWNPGSLAVDGAGSLYVADTGNNRVLKFTPSA
jgi:sugar lactone lactonase YvrE